MCSWVSSSVQVMIISDSFPHFSHVHVCLIVLTVSLIITPLVVMGVGDIAVDPNLFTAALGSKGHFNPEPLKRSTQNPERS